MIWPFRRKVAAAPAPDAPAAVVTPKEPARHRISPEAVARASMKPAPKLMEIPKPPPGVLPEGKSTMAMDDAYMGMASWGNAFAPQFAEGVAWPGWMVLCELAQRAEYRKISETIAREMVRKWIVIQATGEEDDKADKIKKLNDAFDKFKVRDVFRLAAEHDGLYGRGTVFIDTGYSSGDEELSKPLLIAPEKIGVGGLKGLRTIEPLFLYPQAYNSIDPLKDDFYKPMMWWCMGKPIHASRLLMFIGREVPAVLRPSYSFSGISLTQIARPYVDNFLRTRQSVSDTLHSFAISGIKTNMSATLQGGGGEDMIYRAQLFNQLRDNRGLFLLDKEQEDFFTVATPLGTLDHLQAQSQEQIASVSSIPLVKLLGISPSGLNASSEGELQTFYDTIHSYQEHIFSANIEKLLKIMQLHLFGEIDDEIGFRFEPLWQLNEAERANTFKTYADAAVELINAGVLHPEEERKRLANDESSPYQGIDVDDVPELPDPMGGEEDDTEGDMPENASGDPDNAKFTAADAVWWMALDAQWEEGDHPRDDAGKFTSGGGGGGSSTEGASPQIAEAKPKQPKLTPREKSYISSYTGDRFLDVNKELRSGKAPDSEVKAIDSAISKGVLPKGTLLYRGMTREAAKAMVGGNQLNKGDIISDPAFLSTGRNKDFVSSFYGLGGVVLEIETGAGQNGLDLKGLTRNPQEGEVLLPRNTKLRIKGIQPPKKVGDPVLVRVSSVPDDEE